jgi:hypothetical protein
MPESSFVTFVKLSLRGNSSKLIIFGPTPVIAVLMTPSAVSRHRLPSSVSFFRPLSIDEEKWIHSMPNS